MTKPACSSLFYTGITTPLAGQLWLAATEQGLSAIVFDGDEAAFGETGLIIGGDF